MTRERQRLDGRSIVPVLHSSDAPSPHSVFHWQFDRQWAVREGNWKLVKMDDTDPELFNLATDKGETKNLINENPAQAKKLQTAYDEWNAKNIAPLFQNPGGAKAKAKAKAKQ